MLERADFRPERVEFRPDREVFRPSRPDFRPKRAWGVVGDQWMDGRTDKQTNRRMDEQKSRCVLQDFFPFGAAAQKKERKEEIERKKK